MVTTQRPAVPMGVGARFNLLSLPLSFALPGSWSQLASSIRGSSCPCSSAPSSKRAKPSGLTATPGGGRSRVQRNPLPIRPAFFGCRRVSARHTRRPDAGQPPRRGGEQPRAERLFPDPFPGTTTATAVVPRKTRDQPRAVEYLLGIVRVYACRQHFIFSLRLA